MEYIQYDDIYLIVQFIYTVNAYLYRKKISIYFQWKLFNGHVEAKY